jgi:L-iditol 2-dehydrogenase
MKAVVFKGPGRVEIEDIPNPSPSKGEVLVRFRAGSICGTDLHFYRGEWSGLRIGQVIGHDACGELLDTGVRVAMVPVIYCGLCWYCLQGLPHLCENGGIKGFDYDGFFSEYVVLPERNILPIPEGVSDEEAAVLEPVALAIHTLDMLSPRTYEWVTIIGQGPVGLLITQIAKLKGCRVIAIDMLDYRLKLSERFGADFCINAQHDDLASRVMEITGRGSDIVIEAAGTRQAVEQTLLLSRRAGKIALVGEFEGYLNLGVAGEVKLFTSYISPLEYPLALSLIAERKVDVKNLITHRFKLSEFKQAIETANNPLEKPIKVVITIC